MTPELRTPERPKLIAEPSPCPALDFPQAPNAPKLPVTKPKTPLKNQDREELLPPALKAKREREELERQQQE